MKPLEITDLNKNNIWVHDLGNVIFLEGSEFLNNTEEHVYKSLTNSGVICCAISNLYKDPTQILALRHLNFETIVLGTTGVMWKQLDDLKRMFLTFSKLPKNIMFTMGEEYFYDIITDEIRTFKIYPAGFSDTPIPIIEFKII